MENNKCVRELPKCHMREDGECWHLRIAMPCKECDDLSTKDKMCFVYLSSIDQDAMYDGKSPMHCGKPIAMGKCQYQENANG